MKKITLTTHPNGYALDIDGQEGGWFYTNEDELMKGLIYHITLGKTDDVEKEVLDDLFMAMLTWPNADEISVKAKTILKNNQQLERTRKNQCEQIKRLRCRTAELEEIIRGLKKELNPPKENAPQHIKPTVLTPAPIKTTLSERMYQVLTTPLTMDKTGMMRRTLGVLKYAGGKENHTIGDIARLRRSEIQKMRGAGKLVMAEIEKYFITNGIEFGMDVDAVLWTYKKQNEPLK